MTSSSSTTTMTMTASITASSNFTTTSNTKKETMLKSGKVIGYKVPKPSKKSKVLQFLPSEPTTQIINNIQAKDLKQLLGKATFPTYLDFSSPQYQIEDDEFLLNCPNVVKEIDLSNCALVECLNLGHLSKLKRISIDNNMLSSIAFKGLISLEYCSLSQNRIEQLSDMSDLKKLIYLDLSGNKLSSGFNELSKLKTLRTLDLGSNMTNLPIHEFYNYILVPIKKIPRLEFLNFSGNPVEEQIREFKYFIINELPKLKYYNFDLISREDRTKANKLESEGVWDDHLLPVKSSDPGKHLRSTQTDRLSSYPAKHSDGADSKARMLDMLLNDVSEDGEFRGNKSTLSLDQIISGNDPLDDILHHLTGSDRNILDSIPLPKRQFDPVPPSKMDHNYLDLLNDILNSGNEDVHSPIEGVPDDLFSNLLAEVITARDQSEPAPEIPPMPSLSQVEKPNIVQYEANKVKDEPIIPSKGPNINYLDLLEEMMQEKPTKPKDDQSTTSLVQKPTKSSNEDLLDKLIKSQDEKLAELLSDFASPSSLDSTELQLQFPWETLSNECSLSSRLGVGTSMVGEVFRGIWKNQECTLKRIGSPAQLSVEYVRNEIQKLIALRHFNILNLIGVVLSPEIMVINSFMSGINLYGLIHNRSFELDNPFIIRLSLEIATGMAFLHANNVIHRSLKPKNILLDNDLHVKIRDFGFLDIKDAFLRDHRNSPDTKDVCYIAPEVLTAQQYSERVDVYSFGFIIWQCFVREEVFPNLSVPQTFEAIVTNHLRPTIPKTIPGVFQRLMETAWARNPDDRPAFDKIVKILSQPAQSILSYKGQPTASVPVTPDPPQIISQPPPIAQPITQPKSEEIDDDYEEKLNQIIARTRDYLASPSDLAQIRGAKAVCTIAKGDLNIKAVLKSGVTYELTQLLSSKFESVQEQAILALLALAEDEEFCDIFRWELRGFSPLMYLLESSSDNILLVATKLLTKLVTKNEENRQALFEEGGIVQLVILLKNPNEFLQLQTVWALSHILENERCQDEFLDEGGLSPLLKLILTQNPGLQIRTLTALGNLITNNRAQERIVKAGVISRYWDWLSSASPLLQLLALKSIASFSENDRLREEILIEIPGACVVLLSLLTSKNEQTVLYCVRALSHFALTDHGGEQITAHDGIPKVLFILKTKKDETKVEALNLLANLSENGSARATMLSSGVVPLVVAFASSQDIDVKRAALHSLEPFVFDGDSWDVLFSSNIVNTLLPLLGDLDKVVLRRSLRLLSELSQDDEVKESLIQHSFNSLCKLLQEQDPDIEESVLFTLVNLCSYNKDLVNQLSDSLQLIVDAVKQPNINTKESAVRLLGIFATNDSYHSTIISEGLSPLFECIESTEETLQSLALKIVLQLAQNVNSAKLLKAAGAVAHLKSTAAKAKNKTIVIASEKAISFLS